MIVTSASELLTPDRLSFVVTPTMMSVVLQSRGNPAVLEDYFYGLIAEAEISAKDLSDVSRAIRDQLEEPRSMRSLMQEAVKTLVPPQRTGRPAKLDRSGWPILLETSEQLRPFCVALARLQRCAKNRNLEDNLVYLKLDFPEPVEFLHKYLDQAKLVLSDCSFLEKAKSSRIKSSRLADALAGLQFQLAPKYAIQQASRARSAAKKQSLQK